MKSMFHVSFVVSSDNLHHAMEQLESAKAYNVEVKAVRQPEPAKAVLKIQPKPKKRRHDYKPKGKYAGSGGRKGRTPFRDLLRDIFHRAETITREELRTAIAAAGYSPKSLGTLTAPAVTAKFLASVKPGVYKAGPKLEETPES